MTDRERELRQRMKDDFPHYAKVSLRIRTKAGEVLPFELNRAQQYLHERIEAQLADKGRVRVLILKGRQQGCSTYVGGRFYHKVTHRNGVRAFILTHEDAATQNLFEMVQRYHEHNNPLVKPSTGATNAKELIFDKLDSGYKLGTAKTKGTGRSSTIQYFHGSEVAFWANAAEHRSGVMQAVPDAPGTEVILESTANGFDPMFFPMWQDAEAGLSDYMAIFIPWYWQDEYRKPVPADFALNEEERDYAKAYELDDEQMAWRRAKIVELKDPILFKQEYPATAAEAFQVTGHESFIPVEPVLAARKAQCLPIGAHVVGVDPAREGADRTVFIHRRGRKAWGIEQDMVPNSMHIAGKCALMLDQRADAIDRMFIDRGGEGGAIYDRLIEMGYSGRVSLVNFGSRNDIADKDRFVNKRAEMWGLMKDWLTDTGGADIPDSDELQADLCAPGYKYDSEQRVQLESKQDIKKRGLRSPDVADALALTFAFPVAPTMTAAINKPRRLA